MLLLLVAVVLEDRPERVVARRGGALVVPVDRLELLHQRMDRAVLIHHLGGQRFQRFVVALGTHAADLGYPRRL